MNTTENNILIAEFMGLNLLNSTISPVSLKESKIVIGRKYIDTREGKIFECTKTAFPLVIVQDNEKGYYCANIKHCKEIYFNKELQYNSSWDWLMTVVDGILNASLPITMDNPINQKRIEIFKNVNLYSSIDKVYNACAEFIKWYNEQK